mmetsp:Transcript_147875/g.474732  ORF Transcript_147875/g.474732 Transcript_147875/m.474732 type:complete len:257 (-) Transcript_147875:182-952(-)
MPCASGRPNSAPPPQAACHWSRCSSMGGSACASGSSVRRPAMPTLPPKPSPRPLALPLGALQRRRRWRPLRKIRRGGACRSSCSRAGPWRDCSTSPRPRLSSKRRSWWPGSLCLFSTTMSPRCWPWRCSPCCTEFTSRRTTGLVLKGSCQGSGSCSPTSPCMQSGSRADHRRRLRRRRHRTCRSHRRRVRRLSRRGCSMRSCSWHWQRAQTRAIPWAAVSSRIAPWSSEAARGCGGSSACCRLAVSSWTWWCRVDC